MRVPLAIATEPRFLAWTLFGALFAVVLQSLTTSFIFATGLIAANGDHLLLNLRLAVFLGLVLGAWSLLLVRGQSPDASAAGLLLASAALAVRTACEMTVCLFGGPVENYAWLVGEEIVLAVRLCRYGGLIAFAFGIAMAAAALAAEGLRRPGSTPR